jgi:hypothetical protein
MQQREEQQQQGDSMALPEEQEQRQEDTPGHGALADAMHRAVEEGASLLGGLQAVVGVGTQPCTAICVASTTSSGRSSHKSSRGAAWGHCTRGVV